MRFLILFLWSVGTLLAHPHVFIDVYPKVLPDRLEVRWIFDEMNSNMLLMDFDINRDGALSPLEIESLRSEIFNNFIPYDYYTFFHHGEKRLDTPEATGFSATVEFERLIFDFALARPAAATSVHFYDPENWTGYRLSETTVSEANPGKQLILRQHEFDYIYGYILELP